MMASIFPAGEVARALLGSLLSAATNSAALCVDGVLVPSAF
jgi:hypothetical protein